MTTLQAQPEVHQEHGPEVEPMRRRYRVRTFREPPKLTPMTPDAISAWQAQHKGQWIT